MVFFEALAAPLPPARASGGCPGPVLEPRHQVLPLDLLGAHALLRLVARKVLARARSTGRALFFPRHVPNGRVPDVLVPVLLVVGRYPEDPFSPKPAG